MAKKEQGGHSPYEPYKPAPSGPYTPAPSRNSIKIASDADIKSMHYPTEKGFFLDGTGTVSYTHLTLPTSDLV